MSSSSSCYPAGEERFADANGWKLISFDVKLTGGVSGSTIDSIEAIYEAQVKKCCGPRGWKVGTKRLTQTVAIPDTDPIIIFTNTGQQTQWGLSLPLYQQLFGFLIGLIISYLSTTWTVGWFPDQQTKDTFDSYLQETTPANNPALGGWKSGDPCQ